MVNSRYPAPSSRFADSAFIVANYVLHYVKLPYRYIIDDGAFGPSLALALVHGSGRGHRCGLGCGFCMCKFYQCHAVLTTRRALESFAQCNKRHHVSKLLGAGKFNSSCYQEMK